MGEKTNGELHLAARVGRRGVDIEFTVRPGEVLAVLGPNGAGKSTAAAVIAGLLDAEHAVVRVGDRLLTDTRTGVHLAVHDRRVGLLAQDALLFPHMSALSNVAFAARRRAGWRGARSAALSWLEQVGAAELAAYRPGQLSGGQAQRVALARALAAEPEVLVLDEPLSRLDVDGASSVRAALRSVLADRDCATVLITHDLPDVVALADRVLVMENGTAAETGAVTDVLAAPRSRFGARFAGLNVVHGVLRESTVLAAAGGQDWHGVMAEPVRAGQHAVAIFAPASVSVYRERPHGSPRNVVRGLIGAIEANGTAVRIRLAAHPGTSSGLAADVTAGAVADLRLTVGEQVWFSVKTQAVTLFPGVRGHRP